MCVCDSAWDPKHLLRTTFIAEHHIISSCHDITSYHRSIIPSYHHFSISSGHDSISSCHHIITPSCSSAYHHIIYEIHLGYAWKTFGSHLKDICEPFGKHLGALVREDQSYEEND